MIKLKKLNSLSSFESKKTPKSILSRNKLKNITKRVKFSTPVQLNILTPNSISIENKKISNLNITDKKTQKKPKLIPKKKPVIKSHENEKTEKTEKRPQSRFCISPTKKNAIKNSKSFGNNGNIKCMKNYPKTFYQKIYNNIEKMKLNADNTIKIMRNNLRLTNREVFLRATNLININTLINRGLKLKKKSLTKTETKENTANIDKSQNEEKNKKSKLELELDCQTAKNQKLKKNNSLTNINYLGLKKIPIKSFYNIKLKPFYAPLFKSSENNNNYNKNMYHVRFSQARDINTNEVSKKIYDAPYVLNILNSFIKQPEIQLKNIYNKLRLLLNNIQYFYNNLLIKEEFGHAFINMENPVKAHFNSIIEELCILIIKLIPLILKDFYYSLSQLLFVSIPQLSEEKEKIPSNEIECLGYNIHFMQKIKDYYAACVDIYNVIQRQIAEFKFAPNEFNSVNNILDLARFNSTTLISMANAYIEKTKNDDNIINNFEIGVNIKNKEVDDKENGFDRYHKRRKIKVINDKEKIERIKAALNIGSKDVYNEFIVNLNKKNNKENEIPSILNSVLIKNMMKYFNPDIRQQIISQQVIERYKKLELERLKFDPENMKLDDGSSFQVEEKDKPRKRETQNEQDKKE